MEYPKEPGLSRLHRDPAVSRGGNLRPACGGKRCGMVWDGHSVVGRIGRVAWMSEDETMALYERIRAGEMEAPAVVVQTARRPAFLEEGAEPVEVMEKGERRLQLSWASDGSGFVFAREGNIFFKAPEADSARNLTEEFRVPLTESDSTKRSFSPDRWHPDGNALLLRAQDGYYLMELDGEPELDGPFLEIPGKSGGKGRA